ncbi:MAG: 50S ribosomal protein L11 methyltransferase [Pseudomonadota bacterium]|nr:50S ribosomal protein L11 methyltransferase [Pseudomonadota bacterium]
MSSSDWQEWVVETYSHLVEPLEEWLFEQGALAVSLEDNADEPLLEPGPGETPLWQNVKVTALFTGSINLLPIKQALPTSLLAGNSRNDISTLEDRDWERVWMEDFTPIQMGPRLWICPSWTLPPKEALVPVLLDPGLAFGTGTHATTAMCLNALDVLIRGNERIVDFGCGSGILAISALNLGAGCALGVDNDPQAVFASRENAQRNGIEPEDFAVVLPDDGLIAQWDGSADLMVANILAGPLVELADQLISLTAPGGAILLTGVLEAQAPQLIERYHDVNLEVSQQRDGWVLLAGEKPS